MFHCTDQPCTLSFPIGLVKTESDFIVRSVETGLGRWTLVVAVISAHAFFFDFPMTLRIQALCHLILRSQNFQFTRILLVPCCTWKSVPTSISGFWEFLRSLGVICYDRWVLSECYKNYFNNWCFMNSKRTIRFFNLFLLSFLLNEFWPYCQKEEYQITLNHTTL